MTRLSLPSEIVMAFEHLLPPSWKTQISNWLVEDTPSFDYGGYVVGETERVAFLFGKGNQPAVLAGCPFFTEIFSQLGCQYVTSCSFVIENLTYAAWNGT